MEKYIKKQDMFTILDNAPSGVDKSKLIDKYIADGFKIEGINDQPEQPKTMTGSDKATFQATGNEGVVGTTLKTIGNLPSSTIELGKNVVSAVAHPVETVKSVASLAQGVGSKIGEKLLENTDIGQSLLQKTNERRVAAGMPELPKDASGKIQAADSPELQAVNQVGKFVTDRYGSLDKLKETFIEDPAGVLADLSTVLAGGAGIASKVGDISKISEISNVAGKLKTASQVVEPINATTKVLGKVKSTVANSTPGNIISDITPTISSTQKNQVVKALDLTQGDLSNISKKTGNDVTEFIINNNLLKKTPEEIASALKENRVSAKELRNSEIAKVTTTYTPDQIPGVVKGLDTILQGVDGVAGLETIADEIRTLRQKGTFTLEDIQKAKDLIDDNSNIYSKIGDVKSSSTARGLDNLRSGIKTFIEDEVSKATQGATDIKKLNNDIQTSYAIEDAINNRSTRDLTRQKLSLTDNIVLFGGGTAINPLLGIGLVVGKKIIESPSFRLAFTDLLSSQPINKIKTIINEVKNKNISPETQKLLNELAKKAKENMGTIESGSTIVGKTKSEKQQ